jgi:hypothetical protein
MAPLPTTRRGRALACAPLLALALYGCGSSVSTSAFKGADHEVAQTLSNLQSDATAGEQKKICQNDLATKVVASLGGQKACEQAIKDQLAQTDNLELSVQSIKIDPSGKTATAHVKSTYAGKSRAGTVTLVKEGGRWRVSAF